MSELPTRSCRNAVRTTGSTKKSPTPRMMPIAAVDHATGLESFTSSSPMATSAENMSARMPRPSVSQMTMLPRKNGIRANGPWYRRFGSSSDRTTISEEGERTATAI